jgi:hypothetical protein
LRVHALTHDQAERRLALRVQACIHDQAERKLALRVQACIHDGFASGVCYACFHAWIHGLYPVWSFAADKTPEVIDALRQLLSPAKPEFFAEQKMRPNNEVLKSPYIC